MSETQDEIITVIINSFEYKFPKKLLIQIPYFQVLFERWSRQQVIEIEEPSLSPDSLEHIIAYLNNSQPYVEGGEKGKSSLLMNKLLAGADFFSFDVEIPPREKYILIENRRDKIRRYESFDRDDVFKKFIAAVIIDHNTYYLSNDSTKLLLDEDIDLKLLTSIDKLVKKVGYDHVLEFFSFDVMQTSNGERDDGTRILNKFLINKDNTIIYQRVIFSAISLNDLDDSVVDIYNLTFIQPNYDTFTFKHVTDFDDLGPSGLEKTWKETDVLNYKKYSVKSVFSDEESASGEENEESASGEESEEVVEGEKSDEGEEGNEEVDESEEVDENGREEEYDDEDVVIREYGTLNNPDDED